MNATRTVRRDRIERLPAFSAVLYLAMVRANSQYWTLNDDEWFGLELLGVRADAVGIVTLHPRDVVRFLGVNPDRVADRREPRAVVAGFAAARASSVRGGWVDFRRLRGGAYRYRLALPRGEPRELLERKHE